MRNTHYGVYLTQLTRLPRAFPVNCYLVREADSLTLIDTAIPGSAPAILRAAQSIGLPITRILLTHAHGDHVGSLDALHNLLPEAEVMISVRDERLLRGDKSLDPNEPQTPIRGAFQKVTTRPTQLFTDGDRIGSLQVISTPGHTPGHVAFFDTRDRSLIAGDAFQTRAGIAVAGTVRWLFPFPAMATWNRSLALESAQRLRALEPSRLAVGHGEVLEAPLAQMDQAIADTQRDGIEVPHHGA